MGNDNTPRNSNKKKSKKPPTKDFIQSYNSLLTNNTYNPNAFSTIFSQIPQFSNKLFNFFSRFQNTSYQSFAEIVQFLTKYDIQLTINTNLDKIISSTTTFDRFALIYFQVNDKQFYETHKSTLKAKIELIQQFFKIITPKMTVQNIKKIIQSFQGQKIQLTKTFIQCFKKASPSAQRLLIDYFLGKFNQKNLVLKSINIKTPSKILQQQDWAILSMKIPKILENPPYLLYSIDEHGTSIKSLQYQLVGYTGSWILIFSHLEQNNIQGKKTLVKIGAFQSCGIKDIHIYQGNTECFLFSIDPQIKYLSPENGEGESNFFYLFAMNSEIMKRRRGLGFGGSQYQNFKLWIDEDIEKKSYFRSGADFTYGYGYLGMAGLNKLNIKNLQIWGLGNQQNINEQTKYRRQKQQQIMRRRKVDKKEFLSGGFAQNILFQKTFGHRDQIQGQTNQDKKQY